VDSGSSGYSGGIVLPAHNEAGRIGPLLPVLTAAASDLGYLVVVVCNGCQDRTADLARAAKGLRVLEFDWASKNRALNEGELALGAVFPRLYVDADVQTTPETLRILMDALRVDEPIAVRPYETYLEDGASWLVRAYHDARYLWPLSRAWSEQHLEGHHIYGTNERGRARFGAFPEDSLAMDDAYFDRMFDRDQKLAVEGANVEVPLPRTTRQLFRARVRIYQGKRVVTKLLEADAPDRVSIEHQPKVAPSAPLDRLRYWLRGGSLFPNWNPRVVLVISCAITLDQLAKLRASWLDLTGQQAPWR
jgi:glycosyltransferase involved in cell wall biosynthesis